METAFHLSAGDVSDWRAALANVVNFLDDDQVDADPVLVTNGNAAYAVLESSPVADGVRDLLTDGAEVCVCEYSLASRDLDPDDLIAGVEIVSSGVGEVTRRQADGAAYVKLP
ncbi:MAG: DsrE family protein [Haloferacaceae archaeon]